MVDLKQLLKKYIDVVGQAEGVDFLYKSDWTPEEWEILCEIVPGLKERFNDLVENLK